jgi:NADH:ubiquinone oxidoreductase subunit E
MTKKREITLCMGSSCFARGNARTLKIVRTFLKDHGLEAAIFLKGSRCEGLCSRGPVMQVGDRVYTGVTPEKVGDILNSEFPEGEDVHD